MNSWTISVIIYESNGSKYNETKWRATRKPLPFIVLGKKRIRRIRGKREIR